MTKSNRPVMRWRLCQCEVNGLVRPTNGPVRIKSTDIVADDVLKAKLSGPQGGTVATMKVAGRFFYVTPRKNGEIKAREIPADTLTDALHAGVFMVNEELKRNKKMPHKKRPMPHVPVNKLNKAAKAGKKR
jgi:hypothetical protein